MYNQLSTQNSTTNIFLVFDEVEISKQSFLYSKYEYFSKRFRHYNGAENAKNFPTIDGQWLDNDTETAPLILPAFDYGGNQTNYVDQDYILNNVKKYFEIFEINVQTANNIPNNYPLKGNGNRYVKMMPPLFPDIDVFDNMPPKFYPYKRMAWWHEWNQKGLYASQPDDVVNITKVFNGAYPESLFATIGHGADSYGAFPQTLVIDTVHEIGHLYGLEHQGDINDKNGGGLQGIGQNLIQLGLSYYGAPVNWNEDWGTIMGEASLAPFAQWGNTDYVHAVNNSYYGAKPYANQLLDMLRNGAKLKKRPGITFKPTAPGPGFSVGGGYFNQAKITKDNLFARYATSADSSELFGMIGYERDYDIVKVLLTKGFYTFKVEPVSEAGMLKPRLEVLYCQADIKILSERYEEEFPDIWIPDKNSISAKKNKNVFHKVLIENDEEKNVYKVGTNYQTGGPDLTSTFSDGLSLSVENLTLVYLKILGNWGDPVDATTKKPTDEYAGHSNYGSIGKYKLIMSRPSAIIESSYSLPYGRFEEFTYCGSSDTVWLLVQDSSDSSQGDPSKENMWVLELDTIENGETKKRKFIVFGKSLNIDAEEKSGKFYLKVLINGECKKQEFIVGMPRPEEY